MPQVPTRESIELGETVESANLDFKQKVDLDSDRGKVKLVDDVVAMLTAGPGYLVIGVAEERGRFRHFEPIKDDPDAFERRLISILISNIDPRPLLIEMRSFEVDDGFVAVLYVPWHGRRAFQNRLTGGFLTRTGARNTPLTRDEVKALFVPEEQLSRDAIALAEREDRRCTDRRLMQENGPSFHLAVIPEEIHQPNRPRFDRGTGRLRGAPFFHSGGDVLKPCQDGYEALQVTMMEGRSITRVFVGHDWSLYAQVAHPFSEEHGRVTLHEFGKALPDYMTDLADIFGSDLHGPFCLYMTVRNLHRDPRVGFVFPNTDSIEQAPKVVDRIADAELSRAFAESVLRGSIYG